MGALSLRNGLTNEISFIRGRRYCSATIDMGNGIGVCVYVLSRADLPDPDLKETTPAFGIEAREVADDLSLRTTFSMRTEGREPILFSFVQLMDFVVQARWVPQGMRRKLEESTACVMPVSYEAFLDMATRDDLAPRVSVSRPVPHVRPSKKPHLSLV